MSPHSTMHVLRGVLTLLLAGLLAAPVAATAAPKWTRLASPNFVFIGDASQAEIRQVAQQLEQFRATLIRAFGAAASRSPVPTIVFVFASDRSFTPYKPYFHGKPMQVGGYFYGAEDVNYMALVANSNNDDDFGVLFHEYTHFVVSNSVGTLPAWLSEGLAEFYETFESRNAGRLVLIGRPSGRHIETLSTNFMPLAELMAVDHESPVYNEGERRSIFYAESWALVHYLRGNPARVGQLDAYVRQLRGGASLGAAFTAAFKTDVSTLEGELKAYLRRFSFPATQFTFGDRIADGQMGPATVMAEADAQAPLLELVSLTGRPDEARAQLREIVQGAPQAARALTALGRLELRANQPDAAMPLLERAAVLAPDDAWIQGALGRALGDRLRRARADQPNHAALLARARAVLAKAVLLPPASASTLVQLALVELEAGSDLPRARSLVEEALALAPAREHYRLLLAQVLIRNREYDRATALLGQMMATGGTPSVKDNARSLLSALVMLRQQDSARAESAGQRPEAGTPPVPMSGNAIAGPAVPSSKEDPAPHLTLILRDLGPGETRILGDFEAIDCGDGPITLRMTADGKPLRFTTTGLETVQFISYRQDTAPLVSCGRLRPPVRALLTFRPAAASARTFADGEAVAVELVPATYTPRTP